MKSSWLTEHSMISDASSTPTAATYVYILLLMSSFSLITIRDCKPSVACYYD